MIQKQVSTLVPPELNKGPHAMRDLANVKDTPVRKPVPNPPHKRSFGFWGVHATDGGVLLPVFNADSLGNNPEGPFDWVGAIIAYACPASAA